MPQPHKPRRKLQRQRSRFSVSPAIKDYYNGLRRSEQSIQKTWLWLLLPYAAAILLGWRVFSLAMLRDEIMSWLRHPKLAKEIKIWVVDVPGKGKGVVAARHIKPGELLIRELPLLLVPSGTPTLDLPKILLQLSNDSLHEFRSLSYVSLSPDVNTDAATRTEADIRDEALAILTANSVSIGDGKSLGLFPKMARINHACAGAANAAYSWRKGNELFVHAIHPISEGDEVTLSYLDTRIPRAQRREALEKHYGFNCSCDICSLSEELSEASDKRLTEMAALERKLNRWRQNSISPKEAAHLGRQIWALGEEERFFHRRGNLADQLTSIAAEFSNEEAVTQWAHRAAEWYGVELGKDSPRAIRASTYVEAPRSHPLWGQFDLLDSASDHDRLGIH